MVFLVMVIGLFDLGRAVYMYNGVSEAAREIARVTAVYPGITLGSTEQTLDRVAVQKGLIPELGDPTFECVNIDGSASGDIPCTSGDYVRVTISARYQPFTLVGLGGGTINLSSSSSVRVP
jgi:TadE-like protein